MRHIKHSIQFNDMLQNKSFPILLDLNALPNVFAVSIFLSLASNFCVKLHGTSEPKFCSVSQRYAQSQLPYVRFGVNNKTIIFIQDIF